MSRRDVHIDGDPVVQAAAAAHGIRAGSGLHEAICDAAEAEVANWIQELGDDPGDLDELHRLILNRCGLRIERISSAADLVRIETRYPRRVLPVQLELEFGRETEALVFRNESDGRSAAQYVAVVDARGERERRAWFAERHEPAHILARDPSTDQVFRRTRAERPEPIEQVVDSVAARIGFWTPIVKPVLDRSLVETPNLLDAFEAARAKLAPRASREACYRAFTRLCSFPLLMIRSSYACRSGDVGGSSRALRATTVIYNELACQAGMYVPTNYRIPSHSVISHLHNGCLVGTQLDLDDLGRWTDSTGRQLRHCRVSVTARDNWAVLLPA